MYFVYILYVHVIGFLYPVIWFFFFFLIKTVTALIIVWRVDWDESVTIYFWLGEYVGAITETHLSTVTMPYAVLLDDCIITMHILGPVPMNIYGHS